METSVLGTALDGVEIEKDSDEKEIKESEMETEDSAEQEKDKEEKDEETAEDAEEEDEAESEEEETEAGTAEEDEKDGDNVGNFQLAWEYLDVAKVIYSKKEEKDDQLKAADCLLKLGELSMETEQHETAATDLESALAIQKKYLKADDRIFAETHYQLGLAYGLGKEFEKAIQQYQHAIGVIEAKIVSLNKLIEEKEVDSENKENKETDDLIKFKEEIKDLQDLIPEMRNKIEDTRVEQRDLVRMKEVAKEMLGLSGTTKGFGSPTKKTDASGASGSTDVDENGEKKATDISCLVRKKRKPEEETDSTTQIKKIRADEQGDKVDQSGASGAATVNGVNGHTSPEKKTAAQEVEAMST